MASRQLNIKRVCMNDTLWDDSVGLYLLALVWVRMCVIIACETLKKKKLESE